MTLEHELKLIEAFNELVGIVRQINREVKELADVSIELHHRILKLELKEINGPTV